MKSRQSAKSKKSNKQLTFFPVQLYFFLLKTDVLQQMFPFKNIRAHWALFFWQRLLSYDVLNSIKVYIEALNGVLINDKFVNRISCFLDYFKHQCKQHSDSSVYLQLQYFLFFFVAPNVLVTFCFFSKVTFYI